MLVKKNLLKNITVNSLFIVPLIATISCNKNKYKTSSKNNDFYSNKNQYEQLENNFKNFIFQKEQANLILPSEAKNKIKNLFIYNPYYSFGFVFENDPIFSEINDELGSARITYTIRKNKDVKKIDYTYNLFLTNKQRNINKSSDIQKILKELNLNDWNLQLLLDYRYSYDTKKHKNKQIREILEDKELIFQESSNKKIKILLKNINCIEGLDSKSIFYNNSYIKKYIYIKNKNGDKSSRIQLNIGYFSAKRENLEISKIYLEKEVWKNELPFLLNYTKAKNIYAEDVNLNNIKELIKYNSLKINLPSPNFALLKVIKVYNQSNNFGSIDLKFQLIFKENDSKEKKILERTFTFYGFKIKPLINDTIVEEINENEYSLVINGFYLPQNKSDYQIIKKDQIQSEIKSIEILKANNWNYISQIKLTFTEHDENIYSVNFLLTNNPEIKNNLKIRDKNHFIEKFKINIFNEKMAKMLLPSEAKNKVLLLFDSKKRENTMGFYITNLPEILDIDDENGKARIKYKIRRGKEIYEIDYVYADFLTKTQNKINQSNKIQTILNKLGIKTWQLLLKTKRDDLFIEDIENKNLGEILSNYELTDYDEKINLSNILLSYKDSIENLDKKGNFSLYFETFISEIYIKDEKGNKSSKIEVILIGFKYKSSQLISKEIYKKLLLLQMQFNFINKLKIQKVFSTDVNIKNLSSYVYDDTVFENKIFLQDEEKWLKWKVLDVKNQNKKKGSLDIEFEIEIKYDKNKSTEKYKKMFTFYDFKMIPVFENAKAIKNQENQYVITIVGSNLPNDKTKYKIFRKNGKDSLAKINKIESNTLWQHTYEVKLFLSEKENLSNTILCWSEDTDVNIKIETN